MKIPISKNSDLVIEYLNLKTFGDVELVEFGKSYTRHEISTLTGLNETQIEYAISNELLKSEGATILGSDLLNYLNEKVA